MKAKTTLTFTILSLLLAACAGPSRPAQPAHGVEYRLPTSTPTRTPTNTPEPTPISTPEPPTPTPQPVVAQSAARPIPLQAPYDLAQLIAQYDWPVAEATAVMMCESHGQNVQNAQGGPYFGPFQMNPMHFYEGEDYWDVPTNVMAAHRLWLGRGWAPWDCKPY